MAFFVFEEAPEIFEIDAASASTPSQMIFNATGAVPQHAGSADNIRDDVNDSAWSLLTNATPGTPPGPIAGSYNIAPSHHRDFHYRLWVIPDLLRLSNPQLNSDIPFNIWNTNPTDETLTNILVSGSSVLSFDITIGDTIGSFEFPEVNMRIAAGEATIDADIQFVTTNLIGILQVIAQVADTFTLIPDEPVTEYWEFKTDVLVNRKGVEQRIALRKRPRIRQEFTFEIIDVRQRRTQFNVLRKNIAVQSLVPLYQYSVNIDRTIFVGSSKIYCDPAHSNFRVGMQAIVINPTTEEIFISKINLLEADGITLDNTIATELDPHWVVAPSLNAIVNDGSGIKMNNVTGELSLRADSFEEYDLVRPGATRTFDTFDGIPFLNRRPNIPAGEYFDYERETLDNEVGVRQLKSSWLHPKISGERKFTIQRIADPDEMDYWRSFFDEIRGGQKSFLMSTWFSDLSLIDPNADMRQATNMIVNEDYFEGLYYQYDTWKRLQIEYEDGSTSQHVVGATELYENGTLNITLTTPIPNDPGKRYVKYVSFLMRWKATDRVAFRHFANYSEVTFGVFSSDQ